MISPQTKQLRQLRRTIGRNICYIRNKKKITLKKLSQLTSIKTEKLDCIELGKYNVEFREMISIAIALNVDVLHFIHKTSNTSSSSDLLFH